MPLFPPAPTAAGPSAPGVVWFGEAIPESALNASFAAAADCEVFLSIGTSSLVYPAAGLADIAREADAITVEVNPNPTDQSDQLRHRGARRGRVRTAETDRIAGPLTKPRHS